MKRDIRFIYFDWLYSQLFRIMDENSEESYVVVCYRLYGVTFNDQVPNDDNRSKEGEELRDEFLSARESVELFDQANLYGIGKSSLLEMLIGLSRRASFITQIEPDEWARKFLDNLGLLDYSDAVYEPVMGPVINSIILTFNERRYKRSGEGGIFPLRRPKEDQRKVELWDQMSAYIIENRMY